ncbi:hypothetical protein ACFC6H_11585, partial [Enterococcus faecium]
FKKTSHMAMESKKAYGFLFQISTKTNKKELAIKPLLFVYSLKKPVKKTGFLFFCLSSSRFIVFYFRFLFFSYKQKQVFFPYEEDNNKVPSRQT